MADDGSTAPLKPADTTIFLLGRIEGTLTSLQSSVDNNVQAQQAVNRTNEADHAEFRRDILNLTSDVAVLKDSRMSQRYTRSELTQRWMVYAGIPATLLASITLFFMIYNK